MQYEENIFPFDDLQKIYCINVKENVKRKQFMEQQFNVLKIDPSIIEFVEATTPNSEDYILHNELGNLKYKNKVAQAISLSHKKVWENIIKNDYYAAMVLEDDTEFNIEYLKSSQNRLLLRSLNEKQYFIHLLTSYPNKILKLEPEVSNNLASVNIKYGMGAYIINSKAASMLSKEKLFFPVKQPVDDYMWDIKRKLSFRNQYVFLPFICQNASQPKTHSFVSKISFNSNFSK